MNVFKIHDKITVAHKIMLNNETVYAKVGATGVVIDAWKNMLMIKGPEIDPSDWWVQSKMLMLTEIEKEKTVTIWMGDKKEQSHQISQSLAQSIKQKTIKQETLNTSQKFIILM
jgi:hypothetical protein